MLHTKPFWKTNISPFLDFFFILVVMEVESKIQMEMKMMDMMKPFTLWTLRTLMVNQDKSRTILCMKDLSNLFVGVVA